MMIVSSQGGKVFSTYYVVLSVDLINDLEKYKTDIISASLDHMRC